MDGFLRVNVTATTLPGSPTNLFLADEVASTCPLITPSPPTNDLINPMPGNGETSQFIIGDELACKLQHVQDDKTGGDSASSSSSALAEPVCTQLLNHRHHYQHITKDENSASQETNGKVQPLQLTFRNPPDYFFMKWNWVLIRKLSLWTFVACLIAMTSLVVTMISSLPRTCNPQTQWYQGNTIYEIFPASFHDSDNDGIGDLRGISYYADYIYKLGVRGVRLNSIFPTKHYPEDYQNISTLLEVEPKLGSVKDFKIMVDSLHLRNLSLILDLPLHPYIKKLGAHNFLEFNDTEAHEFSKRSIDNPYSDVVTDAILYWLQYGVDGFYLKGLEHFVNDPQFALYLRRWKKILGTERPLIIKDKVLMTVPHNLKSMVLNNVDLVDVQLNVEGGAEVIRNQLEQIQNDTLFSKASMPWIQWSLGDVNTKRLANRLHFSNATLGATLLQLMLPGTPSIFYGDEVGMKQVRDVHGDRQDVKHLHHLGPMVWEEPNLKFTRKELLPWIHGMPAHPKFNQVHTIARMVRLRSVSPSIYVNSVQRDGKTKANSDVKYMVNDLLVLQRFYPRRKSFVVVSNLGANHQRADLSSLLYSGDVVVGSKADMVTGSTSFKEISLYPGESIIISLD